MTGSFWTKSKFMGMSIGVTLIGNLRLFLPEYKEVCMCNPSSVSIPCFMDKNRKLLDW